MVKNIDDTNCGLQANEVKKLERTGSNNEHKNTDCRSISCTGRYLIPEKKVHVWRDGVASGSCSKNHFEWFSTMDEAGSRLGKHGKHYRRATVITQGPFVNDTSRREEENSLNIKITSAFSLKTDMSSTSVRDKELLLSLNHPQPTRIESDGEKLSSRPFLWQQQKQPIKNKVPRQREHQRSFLAIESNSTGPRCFDFQKEGRDLSWFDGKQNTEQQAYTKLEKSREFDSANLNGVWSNSSVTNEDDIYPLKIPLYKVSSNYCNIYSESGPSILLKRDHHTHEKVAPMTPRNVEFETKNKPVNQHDKESICSSEELRSDFRTWVDFKNQYSQTEYIDNLSVGRCQPHIGDPKSLSYTTIRRTKRTREQDESIASDMITHGMPSLLSTTSGEHYLPMALSSHTNNNTNKQFKSSSERQLANYNANVFLPWRFRNISPGSLHELTPTMSEAQSQQSNVHPCISAGSNDNAAVSLKVIYKGKQELERTFNFNSVDSERKFSRVQFFITPAPETLKSLEMTMGLENDEEPIVKIPNYFLDFIPEDRPNDHSAPESAHISKSSFALSPQQGCSSYDKANCKSVDNMVKNDMNARQTKTMSQQNVTMETKILRIANPSKTRVVSFMERASDTRNFTFSSYNSEGLTSVPTPQASAGISNTTATAIPLQVRTWPDAYQEKVPILTRPFKMTCNARFSNEVHTTSDFSNPFSRSREANCNRATSQFLAVSSGTNTENCCQYNLHQKSAIIKKNPRCFSEGFNRKFTQKSINCTTLERKHGVLNRKDKVSLKTHRILTDQETRVESTDEEELPFNTSSKPFVSNDQESSISKDIHLLPELHCFRPTDTTTTEEFVHHSSSHGVWSLSNDDAMISTCSRTSSAIENSTALSFGKRKYQCEVCGRSFSRSNTLITHNRIHTGERPFPCDVCGKAFRQLGNLTRHKLTHAAVKPHTCPICSKCFSRTSNLNTHMRTHTDYKPFVCDFCGKGFHQKVDMKVHRYTHTGEKPHKCNKCGRGFKQLTHLKYHMRTHSNVRLYKCEHCGKGFNQKGNLQAHIYGHTGKRPHRCEICGKSFTLTSTLNTHKRTHAPHKPFKCEYCEKAFYQKNALKTHYISSHPCTSGVCLL